MGHRSAACASSRSPNPGAVVFADDAGAERVRASRRAIAGRGYGGLGRPKCGEARQGGVGVTARVAGRFRTRRSESRSSPSSGPRRHARWRTTGTSCRRSRSTVDSSRSRHESRLCGGRVTHEVGRSRGWWRPRRRRRSGRRPTPTRDTCQHRSMVPSEHRGSRRARTPPRGRIGNSPSMTSWIDSRTD